MGNKIEKVKQPRSGGSLYIQLEDGIGLVTGQFIRGTVHVNQIKPFKAY